MQSVINNLSRERDQLMRTQRDSSSPNNEAAQWKEKYFKLEASIETKIKSTIVTMLPQPC